MTIWMRIIQRHETKSYIIVPFDKNFSLILPPRKKLVNSFLKNFCGFLRKFANFRRVQGTGIRDQGPAVSGQRDFGSRIG
jgi:hypothetical protein